MAEGRREKDPVDPRNLIREAYRIDGISEPECRSIFLDWAIGVPTDEVVTDHIRTLLGRHENDADHPMTRVLRDGLGIPKRTGRQGGRRRRLEG